MSGQVLISGKRFRKDVNKMIRALRAEKETQHMLNIHDRKFGNDPREINSHNLMAEANKRVLDETLLDIEAGLILQDAIIGVQQRLLEEGKLPNMQKMIEARHAPAQYFITIRPRNGTNFEDFYKKVRDYVTKAMFESFELLTFEQKGEGLFSLGDGFHIHLKVNMKKYAKHRWSPSEIVRNTLPHFGDAMLGAPGIKVIPISTDRNVTGYLEEHKSKDGHKELTQITDAMWRWELGLQDVYREVPPIRATTITLPTKYEGSVQRKTLIEFN